MNNENLYKNLCLFRKNIQEIFFAKEEANLSKIDISPIDFGYLQLIDHLSKKSKLNLASFAEAAKVSRPAATKIIKRFIDKDCIRKVLNEKDNREYHLELSPKAISYLEHKSKSLREVLDQKLAVLSEEEVSELTRIIAKLLGDNNWQE